MEYRNLGTSGLKVSAIGLGGNTFGWWADEAASAKVIDAALEAGVNFIDTADMYDRGRSEDFIGKALKGKRDQVIIATKFTAAMGKGPNDAGASRYRVRHCVEASLRRLQTDHIDLYYQHTPDPSTPLEETLRALDDLVHAGKVIYLACSNFAGWQLAEAQWMSKSLNLNRFTVVEARYNFLDREIEKELVPCCQQYGVGIIPWGPLAGGFLTGKYRKGETAPAGARLAKPMPMYDRYMTPDNYARLDKIELFARERGHTIGELALAWLLSRPMVSSVIPGSTRPEQVRANVAAAAWKLTPAEMAELDKI
jgi:aryl-alcohol dehydrogenase-like predicted oxidoreductase